MEVLYDLGVRTVVDLTVPGLGRDTALVGRVAERVRVTLVASTGWYADEVLPPFFRTHGPDRLVGGPDPLVEMFRRDVTEGLGVPITTHSNPHERNGLDQVAFLLDRDVDPGHVVVGHSGDSTELDYLLALLDTGVLLGVDRFGMAHMGSDAARIDLVVELVARGHATQLVLSHDSAFFSRVTPPSWRREHTPHWTHDHLSRRIVPQLLERGIRQEDLDTMMIDNARRLLTPVGAGDRR